MKKKESFNWKICEINFKNFINFECKYCPDIKCKKTPNQKKECYWAILELDIIELLEVKVK